MLHDAKLVQPLRVLSLGERGCRAGDGGRAATLPGCGPSSAPSHQLKPCSHDRRAISATLSPKKRGRAGRSAVMLAASSTGSE